MKRRSAVLLVMLFAMFWQTMAVARAGSTMNASAGLEHAVLHWQEVGHHHHQDGSFHLDDSKDSAQHLLCDHLSATAAPMVSATHDFPPLASAAPGSMHEAVAPDPTLDGLLRPPRHRS